ncbi:hypothetical protein OCS65_25395 [Rhodococcus aetherivorans]|uniref:Uncharacterized protein n=1 Tax=Rhodococcus aetherivorans TaxID=191292 RepID=A0AA46P9G0_9NOCA|nr:hypothetical protein [Rhodococcus aetherivorans]UGQ40653.1 hypothetical protein LRQ66_21255 [Rhodococcus aetherivorans]UYF93730.1 hypothetical protein OCS65_25395 [Rhodococcus aetherivorans]
MQFTLAIAEDIMRRALNQPQNKAATGTPDVDQVDLWITKAVEVADAAGL